MDLQIKSSCTPRWLQTISLHKRKTKKRKQNTHNNTIHHMKKLILVAIIGIVTTFSASAQRGWANAPKDNTGRNLTFSTASPSIGSTDSIAPNTSYSFYKMAVAGAKTLHVKNSNARLWDKCLIEFTADGTNRLITLTGNDMLSSTTSDTITVFSSRKATVEFYYNGTKWVQLTRYQQK